MFNDIEIANLQTEKSILKQICFLVDVIVLLSDAVSVKQLIA